MMLGWFFGKVRVLLVGLGVLRLGRDLCCEGLSFLGLALRG